MIKSFKQKISIMLIASLLACSCPVNAFADEIIKLYDNFDLLNSLSVESQKVINTRFTMEAAWDIIKEDFTEDE